MKKVLVILMNFVHYQIKSYLKSILISLKTLSISITSFLFFVFENITFFENCPFVLVSYHYINDKTISFAIIEEKII